MRLVNPGATPRGSEVHASHSMTKYEIGPHTVHACLTCGNASRDQLLGLGKPCKKTMERKGKDSISRLRRGLLPGTDAVDRAWNVQQAAFKPQKRKAMKAAANPAAPKARKT